MHNDTMSDARADAIGKMLSTVIMGLLAAMFAYAYIGHMLAR